FAETPQQAILELNADATDYAYLGEGTDEAFESNWDVLQTVLAGASGKMSRREILSHWPAVEAHPDEATLWRWLERAVADGRLKRSGNGYRGSPFEYWHPEAAARWQDKYRDLRLDQMEDVCPDPCKHLPPLLPPSIRKLVEKRDERRG